ncbi:MAG: hypothetical protein K2O00_07315 [Muribaculaceae bacterium]|nr:hypothetical protein [Muribaculaceae bacterium]
MKKLFISAILAIAALTGTNNISAQVPITRVEQYSPTDMVFLDMATDAAKENKSRGMNPNGAVLVVNGEFKASGRSTAGSSAEEIAFKKSHLPSLKGVTVYTVNEPTTAVYQFLCDNNVDAIFFVNGRDAVVKAGIASASDYNDSALPESTVKVTMKQIEFPDASLLLK